METAIYIPMILFISDVHEVDFNYKLYSALEDMNPPNDIRLIGFRFERPEVIAPILQKIVDVNNPNPAPDLVSDCVILRFVFEAEENLLYKRLDWLEKSLLDIIKEYHSKCGLIAFYHINGGVDIHSFSMGKLPMDDETSKVEPINANIDPILEYKDFFRDYYYSDKNYTSWAQAAKYYLTYGDPENREEEPYD